MALKQRRFLEVLRQNLTKLENRCPEYHNTVLTTILQICKDEKGHSQSRTSIKNKVRTHCQQLGQFLDLNRE
jgi:hypothetical protein